MLHWRFFLVPGLAIALACGRAASAGAVERLAPEQAQTRLQTQPVFLLDVRTDAEYREAHIPGTDGLIAVQGLSQHLKELEHLKGTPILVYCRSGNRSLVAAELLKKNGFQNVTDLKGGILAWASKGYPTETGPFVPSPSP